MLITNATNSLKEIDFTAGAVILVDKPLRWSSFKVIHETRKVIGIRKLGHAGTLDPLATGLLILCSGKMTRSIDNYQGLTKVYTGSFLLGKSTPTQDAESAPDNEYPTEHITPQMLDDAVQHFTGDIQQVPPMFSAVNHAGKKLYEYARKGRHIDRPARTISIYSFELTEVKMPEVFFRVTCSKGTYIRTLADDFGRFLGSGAYLTSLRREAIGEFSVADACTMEHLRSMKVEIPQL